MKISTLSIKNFRSISELDIDLPNVCAFVGPNNAGKTNILEAIRRAIVEPVGLADFLGSNRDRCH